MGQVPDRHNTPFAVYVHIPFCLSKCLYCDFNSYSGRNDIFDAYTDAVVQDINCAPEGPPLETVYFGGGTPTVLGADRLCSILQAITSKYSLANEAEISVEANPGTITIDMLSRMNASGFNRLSLGAQSFHDQFLNVLGRIHNVEQIAISVNAAHIAGFKSVSLDLMYGLPGQTVNDWLSDLSQAIGLGVEHISAYELTVEDDTPLAHKIAAGDLCLPLEDEQIEMVNQAQVLLCAAGYQRYEVSNYCKPGFDCRHNLKYWHNEAHWGFGAGSVGYSKGVRRLRLLNPDAYIESVNAGQEPVQFSETITGRLLEAETLMMGLRLTAGISMDVLDIMSRETRDISDSLIRIGLLHIENGMLRATPEGYLKLSDVAQSFLP